MVREEIERWHQLFPADLVRHHIEELKAERDRINQQIVALEDEYQRWLSVFSLPPVQANGSSTATVTQSGYDKAETGARRKRAPVAKAKAKRRAILDLLEARYPKKVPSSMIRQRLIADGLVADTLAGRKNVDAILYHMNREDLVDRAGRGEYRAKPPTEASVRTNVQSEGGGGP